MQTSSQLQLLPAVTDNATFYVVLQPKSSGLTNSMLVSTALSFNPSSNTFQLNGSVLSFLISNSEKMRLDSSGNVGVGTTTPSANLTVVGTTLIQNSANTAGRGSTIIQATTATTAQTAIDTWSTTSYRTAKYLVQMTQGSNYHTIELLLLQNGTTAYLTQYGEVTTDTILGTFDASISGSTLSLLIIPTSSTSMTINLVRDTISV
jgi:hypothetical protein